MKILTGGVSITEKEVSYVNDALINGWDQNHNSYIKKFEEAFAAFTGTKFAKSTSGGTQALMLSLATLGVGPGDEVILPDLTYFACSDVIVQLGAKPIFVDVDKETWCIDPADFEDKLTARTKAVMPVWMYGNAPDMNAINDIAIRNDIFVVEDACPAVGSSYGFYMAGGFSDFGCFSFHGAKIMTTGFGGMLVTDNEDNYKKMLWLSDHGEDKTLPYRFWQTAVGFSFDLPNINCAMGLAQLERIDEFVDKKRQIFEWYYKRLGDIKGISMNKEKPLTFSNMWLTSIVLDKVFKVGRDGLMKALKEKDIDTRPFFFPISVFPMYNRANTPYAYHLGYNGINLPSGVQRTEEEIDHICVVIKEALGVS